MPDPAPLILIIEDEIPLRSLLIASLMDAGYRVARAATGCRGLVELTVQRPDAILLDLGLPDIAGTEVVRQVRERSSVPILALCGGSVPGEAEVARDAGADDVVSKPFDVGEILQRLGQVVQSSLDVADRSTADSFRVGELCIDLVDRRVTICDKRIDVTATEFALLATLIHHAGRVVTYRSLINQLWNSNAVWQIAYLKLLVSGLRHKLEPNPMHPRYVLTERGTGYRMALE